MLQKQLLIAGSVLSALALGHQVVNADNIQQATETSTAQIVQATTVLSQDKAGSLATSLAPVGSATSSSDDFGDNDDSNLPGGDTDSSSSSDNGSSNSSSENSGTDTPAPTTGDDNVNGSTMPDDNGGSSSGNGGSSSSSDNGGSSSDSGRSNSSSDQGGSSSNNGETDNSNAGGSSSSNDNNTVPLTPSTPDKNDQGEINHVKPVEVTPDSSGNVVLVPTQVASAISVESYNQALTANDKDANNDKVVEAKKKLDDAVAKALPETHATQAKSSIGILSAVSGVLAMTGALIFKRFKN